MWKGDYLNGIVWCSNAIPITDDKFTLLFCNQFKIMNCLFVPMKDNILDISNTVRIEILVNYVDWPLSLPYVNMFP